MSAVEIRPVSGIAVEPWLDELADLRDERRLDGDLGGRAERAPEDEEAQRAHVIDGCVSAPSPSVVTVASDAERAYCCCCC